MTATVLEDVTVLDAAAGELIPDQAVVVEGERIVDVGSGIGPVGDAHRIKAAGMVVLPGLIDAHCHPTVVDPDVVGMADWSPTYVAARAAKVLSGMLDRGFTTIRDVGGADFGLARAVKEGYFRGPRVLYGGKQLSQTGGAGDMRVAGRVLCDHNYLSPSIGVVCDGVDEVRRAVREEVRRGAHHIKVYLSGAVDSPSDRVDSTQFSEDELRAIVEEADAANIYVAGHAYTSRAINRGLECGVRSIEHGNLMDESSIPLFRARRAFYVPTIVTYRALAAREAGLSGIPGDVTEKLGKVIDAAMVALELAHRAGLPIVYGTDLLAEMHDLQLEEFTIRAEVQPNADIIRSATTTAAQLVNMEGRLGVVAPGAQADLLVVDGDPLSDISVLTKPGEHLRLVMQGGELRKNVL